MYRVRFSAIMTFGVSLLMAGVLAGSLAACAARTGPASATPSDNPADQVDAELQTLQAELDNADTLNDLSTALPPDQAAATPAPGTPTDVPADNVATPAPSATLAPSGTDQADQIDQMLATLEAELNNTDTVTEAANP